MELGKKLLKKPYELYLNPTAQPLAPALGHVLPALNVSEPCGSSAPGSLALELAPPPAAGEFVMFDYVSALPPDGGIEPEV